MRIDHYMPRNLKVTFILSLALFLGAAFAAQADDLDDLPDAIRRAIDEKFPNATINKIEREMWKGQPVTEVELTAKDGVEYEVLISDSGEIVSIEEED